MHLCSAKDHWETYMGAESTFKWLLYMVGNLVLLAGSPAWTLLHRTGVSLHHVLRASRDRSASYEPFKDQAWKPVSYHFHHILLVRQPWNLSRFKGRGHRSNYASASNSNHFMCPDSYHKTNDYQWTCILTRHLLALSPGWVIECLNFTLCI